MRDDRLGMSKEEFLDEVDPNPKIVSLKQQLADAIGEIKTLKAQVGDDERLFDHIKGGLEVMPEYPRVAIPKPKLSHADMEVSVVVTDAHSEEVVDPAEVEDLAEYNWKIFEQRMMKVPEKTVELTNIMRQASNIRNIQVWMLGDWFLGTIHPDEMSWGSSMPLPCALPAAARAAADMVMRLAAHFDNVKVFGLCGNHGRTTNKPVSKMTADRNWDYSLYLIARLLTERAKNVEWVIPRSKIHVADIMGWKVALTHGDICKRTHTSPYFGIANAIKGEHTSRRRTNKDFDYAFMGHWHHYGVLENEVMICPPMVGHSQFSQYMMHSRHPAQQNLIFWTEKYGRTCMWPISLE